MAEKFTALVEAHGVARFGGPPDSERAAELGRTIKILLDATRSAANGLPLETEPADYINVINSLADK